MIELAGDAATAPTGVSTHEDRFATLAPTDAALALGGLVFDDTMAGLTLDEVSVVLVADRPVLVPLSRELAERSGFTVVNVSDESLLSIGVSPRRSAADLDDLATSGADRFPAPIPPVPFEDVSRPSAGSDPGAPTDAWATWPTGDSTTASTWSSAPASVESPIPPSNAVPPTADLTSTKRLSTEWPSTPAPSLTETPVETARPINAMAASHLDWEPEALGWPYIDRRLELESTEGATAPMPIAPRSLTSGRPVNAVAPAELLIRGEAFDADDPIIELRAVAAASLEPLTLDVAAMSITVLSGRRGSGKTSLLRLLAGFDAPTQGSGVVGGEQLLSIHLDDRAAREAISAGFVPQLPFLVPDLTVAENVELPLLAGDVSPAMARGVAEETLRMVGLGTVIGLPAALLSGSEIRLAAVARALVSSPEIVFADEPFAGLSDDDATTVLKCLLDVVADGGSVIIACTDPRVRLHEVRQLTLDAGGIVGDEIVSAIK